jgi:hypothetical protein
VPEPIQTSCWPGGWCLVGDGPSYLLFRNPQMEVTHLSSGLHRELREALRNYHVISSNKELAPLVQMLLLASADAIYDADPRADAASRKWAAFVIVREIERLLRLFPERATFKKELGRFSTCLRAAGQIAMFRSPPGVPGSAGPPGSFFAGDRYGQRLLIMSNPSFVFRCEPKSPFAECARKLWRPEQGEYRVPTRKELRMHLSTDDSTITKLCKAAGFDWLPRATRTS